MRKRVRERERGKRGRGRRRGGGGGGGGGGRIYLELLLINFSVSLCLWGRKGEREREREPCKFNTKNQYAAHSLTESSGQRGREEEKVKGRTGKNNRMMQRQMRLQKWRKRFCFATANV